MSPLVPNWPALVIVLILVLLLGIIAIFSPITLIKLTISWPIRSVNHTSNNTPSKLREAVGLLDNNPEKFGERFRYTLLFMRGIGCLMLAMVLFTIFILILALITG